MRPHLAIPDNTPAACPVRRFRGFRGNIGYAVSQVVRKRVEEIFGWGKTVGGSAGRVSRGASAPGLAASTSPPPTTSRGWCACSGRAQREVTAGGTAPGRAERTSTGITSTKMAAGRPVGSDSAGFSAACEPEPHFSTRPRVHFSSPDTQGSDTHVELPTVVRVCLVGCPFRADGPADRNRGTRQSTIRRQRSPNGTCLSDTHVSAPSGAGMQPARARW